MFLSLISTSGGPALAQSCTPALLGNYDTPGYADGVYVSGTTAYVADNTSGGLQVIKVMDVCGSTPPSTTTTTTTSTTTTTLPIKKICRRCPSAFRVRQGRKVCKEFTVWNCGKGMLNWSVSEDCNWLTLEPSSGISAGERDTVTACVDTTGLDAGNYSCTVTITGTGASNSPGTCVIKLKVR